MKTSRMELMELLADAWLRAAEAELREQAKDVFIEELLRNKTGFVAEKNTDATTH